MLAGVTDPAVLLATYDEQLRVGSETDASLEVDRDGPLVRVHFPFRGFVSYRTLDGLTGDELDALIARQCAHFAERGQAFEWKTRGHDLPLDLAERLTAAGFVPEDVETVVIGETAQMAADPVLPAGVRMREARELADFERIAVMHTEVWAQDHSWMAADLARRVSESGDLMHVLLVETDDADPVVVSAAWLVFKDGTDFAGLWGGSTLAAWRGRGIYRALVARRAQLAHARGVRYLQVDASKDSRPILERLGFVAITTTTPYIWTPPSPG